MNIISKNQEETSAIAAVIASFFDLGDIIILNGDLAAGKTHFVKGFSEYYQVGDVVNSPTYTIANSYRQGKKSLLHMDLYRIPTIEQFDDLGIEEFFPDSIVLIEWGNLLFDHLDEYFGVNIDFVQGDHDQRKISFFAKGERSNMILESVNQLLANYNIC